MKFKFSIKLATISLIGNIIIAIGVSTCRISQMGIDPFTSMTTGISSLLNIPLGIFQGSVNAVLFLALILLNKRNLKYLNIGAIINMFLLGFFVQFFNDIYCKLFSVSSPDVIPFSLPIKFMVLIIGILFVTIGCSLYMTSDLGTGCYDALSIYMSEEMSPSYPVCRIMTDVVCVLLGFISGGPLGIATIFLMFGTGPLISAWNKLISKPIIDKFA